MSEVYTDSNSRSFKEPEYVELSEQEYQTHIKLADEVLDSIFSIAHPTSRIANPYSSDSNGLHRNLEFAYVARAMSEEESSVLFYDPEKGEAITYELPVIPVQHRIKIDHYVYNEKAFQEEYVICIEYVQREIDENIANYYYFSRNSDGLWQGKTEGKTYYHEMLTATDFKEFAKDIAQIRAYLEKLLVQ